MTIQDRRKQAHRLCDAINKRDLDTASDIIHAPGYCRDERRAIICRAVHRHGSLSRRQLMAIDLVGLERAEQLEMHIQELIGIYGHDMERLCWEMNKLCDELNPVNVLACLCIGKEMIQEMSG